MAIYIVIGICAVFVAVWTVPPRIANHHSTVRTFVPSIVGGFILAWQTSQWAVFTESVETIIADFVTVAVTSVVTKFVVFLGKAEYRAFLTRPAMQAYLTSVLGTTVMATVVVVRNTLLATVAAKPCRQTLFRSIRSTPVGEREGFFWHACAFRISPVNFWLQILANIHSRNCAQSKSRHC